MYKLMIVMATTLTTMWAQVGWAQDDARPVSDTLSWDGDWSVRLEQMSFFPQRLEIGGVGGDIIQVSPRGVILLPDAVLDILDAAPTALSDVQDAAARAELPPAVIAPFWADLAEARCEDLADPGVVSYAESLDDNGRPILTIRWENIPQADCVGDGRATFEVDLRLLQEGLQIVFKYESLPALRPHPDRPGVVAAPRAGIVLGQAMELLADGGPTPVTNRGQLLLSRGSEGVRDEPDAPGMWVIELGSDGAVVGDRDFDGVRTADNCPDDANPLQVNTDREAELARGEALFGDVCDDNDDNDFWRDNIDNCPLIPNDQADVDDDGVGDACDDSDGDGWLDAEDNCWASPNVDQLDLDGDDEGDRCDSDVDGDGVDDSMDNCVRWANPGQADLDRDGAGDRCDVDDDQDGVKDELDNCVSVYNPGQFDLDRDRQGDACDADPDGDGVPTIGEGAAHGDLCPWRADPRQADRDGDWIGDACDLAPDRPCIGACQVQDTQGDADGDGVPSNWDLCPTAFDPWQLDQDVDGKGNACDPDADGDQIIDVLQGRCFNSLLGPIGDCDWMTWTDSSGDDWPPSWTEEK